MLIFIGISQFALSQTGNVGINTVSPTSALDINGDARIRKIDSTSSVPDYILTSNNKGVIQKVKTDKLSSGDPEAIKKKIFAVFSKRGVQTLSSKGIDYNLIYDGTITGINTDKVSLNSAKDRINLPPNKTFKITGYIGIRGSAGGGNNNPGYVTSLFSAGGNAEAIVITQGYTESSTEKYDDGGMTPPIIILTTGSTGDSFVELKVRYGGTDAGNSGYNLSGAPNRTTIGTYILLEEL